MQAVSVGTVKNLSSQYICTHALQVVDAHPAVGFGSPRYAGFNYGRCACRLCGCMCVYILLRKFLSLFRHFLWIGCWQDVGCEVLQAVSVGTVKNLSSQYICTHALQVVDAHPAVGFGSPRYAGFNYGRCACRLCGCMCVYILLRKFLSLFRHFLRIGYWQEVCCEVLQAVSVGTVKNLSSQYIYTHALQALAVPDMQDLIMAGAL